MTGDFHFSAVEHPERLPVFVFVPEHRRGKLNAHRVDAESRFYRLLHLGKHLEGIVHAYDAALDSQGFLQLCVRTGLDAGDQGAAQVQRRPVRLLVMNCLAEALS